MKKYDLVVKTGTYTNAQGEEKGRFKNVGACMSGKDGGFFLLLDRTFNPAGAGDGEACLISMFEPKQREQQPQPHQQSMGGMGQGQPAPQGDYGPVEPPF